MPWREPWYELNQTLERTRFSGSESGTARRMPFYCRVCRIALALLTAELVQSFKKRKGDDNMLWRQRLRDKQTGAASADVEGAIATSVRKPGHDASGGGSAVKPGHGHILPAQQSPTAHTQLSSRRAKRHTSRASDKRTQQANAMMQPPQSHGGSARKRGRKDTTVVVCSPREGVSIVRHTCQLEFETLTCNHTAC